MKFDSSMYMNTSLNTSAMKVLNQSANTKIAQPKVNTKVFSSTLKQIQANTTPEKQEAKRRETAQDFEAFFMQMTLKEIRPKNSGGLFDAGMAEEVFHQFMDEEIAKEISKGANSIGISDAVYMQMSK